jgi:hypothetical protein
VTDRFHDRSQLLAEHDRRRSALAAPTATFPLHDVTLAIPPGLKPQGTAKPCALSGWCLANPMVLTPRRRRALRRARRRQNAGAGWWSRMVEQDGGAGWWRQTGSNRRPHACKARALPAELCPLTMVGLGRLERPTSPLSGVRSNHLSYRPRKDRSPSARGHETQAQTGRSSDPDKGESETRTAHVPHHGALTEPLYPMTPREERTGFTPIITEEASLERR